jgi:subtilase family serine protease
MKIFVHRLQHHFFLPLSLSVAALLVAGAPIAQAAGQTPTAAPAVRIAAEINSSQMSALPDSKRSVALAPYDTGRLSSATKLQGVSIYFSRTQSQEANLQALMAAQQNPSSPQYHQWLTPDQFAAQFGMADADIAKVQSWLQQQGFAVDSVNRSKNMIRFSGTAGQVEAAFATQMHTYTIKTATGVENHFAPATALSVPSALAGVVQGVHNLDDFRPKPHFVLSRKTGAKPNFTQNYQGTQYVYFAPGDIYTVYDVQKAYNAGYTGAGQSIAVVGQSEIDLSDIAAFQTAANLPVKAPALVYVPDTGAPAFSAGDWTESSLDLEWSGAIATGATISLVYTGSASNAGAFDSIEYAIDERVANIISSSYGTCEAALDGFSLESEFEQAATQGQTVMSAAGDDGSSDCYGTQGFTATQQEALGVDYPGTSPNVTSVGGTEISQASTTYETPGDGYWEAESTSGSFIVSSAQQYIPEQAWNEDTTCLYYYNLDPTAGSSALCSGGGGASTLFPKPSWQTGVPGIPNDGKRDVPDLALNAAIFNPGYLFCTSDQSAWAQGQEASCNDSFLDAASLNPTVAGGTSFAAPIFSGLVALINQKAGYTSGQGPINTELYSLAANSSTYATAFHDITVGNNYCLSGATFCSSSSGTETNYAAGVGYDQATGLGSVDAYNLITAWPANTGVTSGLIATTTTVTASNAAPTINTSDSFTITVTSDTPGTTPTGTVNITVDSGTAVPETLTSDGTYVYSTTFTTTGTHTILVSYAGNSTYAASTSSTTVTVAGTSSGSGTFSLAATGVSVAEGATGTSTITVTPASGYTGTVYLSFDTSNDTALENLCYEFTNTLSDGDGSVSVTGTAAVTTQLQLDANAADCVTTAAVRKSGKQSFRSLRGINISSNNHSGTGGNKSAPASIAFAGLLLAGFLGRYSRKFRSLAAVIALVAVGLAVSACGGGSTSTTVPNPPAGTYTITVTGQDATNANIPTATTSFTFTIQ